MTTTTRFRQLRLGQFETPAVLCDLMLDAVVESPGARILDPATGVGIFMQRALQRGHPPGCLYAVEADGETDVQLPRNLHLYRGSFLGTLPQQFRNFNVIPLTPEEQLALAPPAQMQAQLPVAGETKQAPAAAAATVKQN